MNLTMSVRKIFFLLFVLSSIVSYSQTKSIGQGTWSQRWGFEKTIGVHTYDMQFPVFGVDSISSEWFDLCFHSGNLSDYLDKQADYISYFGQTGGTWSDGNAMLFSIQGNSYRMNRFYKDGFRIDSRFMPGTTVYQTNLLYNNLIIDTHQSKLNFESIENLDANVLDLTFDASGFLGGPDFGAFSEQKGYSLYPNNRDYTYGGTEIDFQYHVEDKQTVRYYRTFRHHVYADFGWRNHVSNDLNDMRQTNNYYWRVQADAEIPLPTKQRKIERRDMVRMYYLINASQRTAGQEFGFNSDELFKSDFYTASIYFRNPEWNINKYRLYGRRHPIWTLGITYGLSRVQHKNTNFRRYVFDEDGMSFSPWVPNSRTHEGSFACNLYYDFNSWLRIRYDGFNSLIVQAPNDKDEEAVNTIVFHSGLESDNMYNIHWEQSRLFGLLLENTVSLEAHYRRSKIFGFRFAVDGTLDGFMLWQDKMLVRPNWQAELSFDWRPLKVLEIGLTAANYRIPFSINEMRFLSNSYMNGDITYISGSSFSTTGGATHSIAAHLRQPQYFVIDLPIKFAPGRHEFSINTVYKKFYNLLTVNYDGDPTQYGDFIDGVFYRKASESRYIVEQRSKQGNNIVTNTPFFISNTIKYAYNGRVVYMSASWQTSIFRATAMGNGVYDSDILALSENMADPNFQLNQENTSASVRQLSRLFTGRMMISINASKHWRMELLFKYSSPMPWLSYNLATEVDLERAAMIPEYNSLSMKQLLSGTDPLYDIDANITYRGVSKSDKVYALQLVGYNLYDFASRLNMNSFNSRDIYLRTLPRGVMLKLKFEL